MSHESFLIVFQYSITDNIHNVAVLHCFAKIRCIGDIYSAEDDVKIHFELEEALK